MSLKMETQALIVSDGTPENTHVTVNGRRMHGITEIVIHPIKLDQPVSATFTIVGVELHLAAQGYVKKPASKKPVTKA